MLDPGVILDGAVDDETAELFSRFHLYLVAWRPRTVVLPETVRTADGMIHAEFQAAPQGTDVVLALRWPDARAEEAAKLEAPRPHDVVNAVDSHGTLLWRRRASALLTEAVAPLTGPEREAVDQQFLDLGVQLAGPIAALGSFEELRRHEPVVAMLHDVPGDVEAWLVLTEFVWIRKDGTYEDVSPPDGLKAAKATVEYFESSEFSCESDADVDLLSEPLGVRFFSKVVSPAFRHRISRAPSPD